ncbi:MAG TPA: class I SAM-dependent methyltransferase [Streptosporangiaceae bacterium]|nr:class I SAM-dependent methyltransferase [Streptosporangiaceae bacterium]
MSEAPGEFNHNYHYHRVVFDAIPAGCERALDVGCGTGRLTRELRRVVPSVTGIDRDERSIEAARSNAAAGDIEYLRGDFLEFPFPLGGFDLVTAVASLHHMDTAAALTRTRDLLRPGGVLVVIGLARDGLSRDLAVEIPAVVYHRIERRRHSRASGGVVARGAVSADGAYRAPVVWPPAETYQQIRRVAASLLPGMRYRRHLLWRYSICWVKPAAG